MANGVTTEWEDIHVKLGNYVARDKSPTGHELAADQLEAAEGVNPFEDKKMKELDDNDSDF